MMLARKSHHEKYRHRAKKERIERNFCICEISSRYLEKNANTGEEIGSYRKASQRARRSKHAFSG